MDLSRLQAFVELSRSKLVFGLVVFRGTFFFLFCFVVLLIYGFGFEILDGFLCLCCGGWLFLGLLNYPSGMQAFSVWTLGFCVTGSSEDQCNVDTHNVDTHSDK